MTASVSSNLRKVNLLLQALEDAAKDVDYYALDLSLQELERTLAQLPRYQHVRAHGLLGTYDDGQIWLKDPSIASRQKCIMSLGSSVGELVGPCVILTVNLTRLARKLRPSRCCCLSEVFCRCAWSW